MTTEMTVVPAPAAAAFGITSVVTEATGIPAVAFSVDSITTRFARALLLGESVDAASATVASQGQEAAGQLGASQVQSYVDTDAASARSLSDTGVINT